MTSETRGDGIGLISPGKISLERPCRAEINKTHSISKAFAHFLVLFLLTQTTFFISRLQQIGRQTSDKTTRCSASFSKRSDCLLCVDWYEPVTDAERSTFLLKRHWSALFNHEIVMWWIFNSSASNPSIPYKEAFFAFRKVSINVIPAVTTSYIEFQQAEKYYDGKLSTTLEKGNLIVNFHFHQLGKSGYQRTSRIEAGNIQYTTVTLDQTFEFHRILHAIQR